MKFGFIAHPTSALLKRHAKLVDMFTRHCLAQESSLEHVNSLEQGNRFESKHWRNQNIIPFTRLDKIVSKTGAECSGTIYYMPLTAEEMLAQPKVMAERVVSGVNELQQLDAELVGLGGFTGIVGKRGLNTVKHSSIPVTTGNSLTAYVTYQNILNVLKRLKTPIDGTEITIVGYPGSIALVVAKLLLPLGAQLRLVHRNKQPQPAHLLDYIPDKYHAQLSLTNDIASCYESTLFYVAASSTGDIIDPTRLRAGAVVVDAALPRDVMQIKNSENQRHDILLIDGGLISASKEVSFGSPQPGFDPRLFMNGCLAETLILALENRPESFSIGRELSIEKVLDIGEVALKHGFDPAPLASLGIHIKEKDWAAILPFHYLHETALTNAADIKSTTSNRFRQYINPVMADFYEMNHLERVFVRGEGVYLTCTEGDEYLDFVAGYGCLNVGHNHPEVNNALAAFFKQQQPIFVQYVSMPHQTALLAEHLATITPGKLSRSFFSNSGTEAVEAAIKLAISASKKSRILYCDNGYHGKTLGALSVTGRDKHREAFQPLLPRCYCIPFGDLAELKLQLQQGDVCAFILEPIQGEGGVILPPEDYLTGVQRLCHQYDCIFILDEIQTGLGRTGKMFYCEWDNIQPDILILSKSLSGGAIPIGVTITTPTLWDRAYGSMDRCALHTSTFGGGNLAAIAGLTTLQLIEKTSLPANAQKVGIYLQAELQRLTQQYPFIKDIRGKGLMIGIEFGHSFDGSVAATVNEMAHRFSWDAIGSYQLLSDKAKYHFASAITEVEQSMEDMFVLKFVTKLAQEHKILTFVTANSNKVMRIQPPLMLTQEEAKRFVLAFAQVCHDMNTF